MTPVYDIQVPVDLLHEGKSDEAIPILQSITDAMPAHVTAHVLLAQALTREERWEEAKLAWQNAAFLMPNSPAIRRGFSQVLNFMSRSAPKSAPPAPEPEATASIEPELSAAGAGEPSVEPEPQTVHPESGAMPPETRAMEQPKSAFKLPLPPVLASFARQAEIEEDEELDDLIEELEAARIVPKPDHENVESPTLESDIDDMVSETLARIFEGQKQFDEAARVYDKLATLQPERADDFNQKASDLRARAANESD